MKNASLIRFFIVFRKATKVSHLNTSKSRASVRVVSQINRDHRQTVLSVKLIGRRHSQEHLKSLKTPKSCYLLKQGVYLHALKFDQPVEEASRESYLNGLCSHSQMIFEILFGSLRKFFKSLEFL